MSVENQSVINALVEGFLGPEPARAALAALDLDPRLTGQGGPHVTRAAFAMAMNVALFHDLLERVPSGAAYVAARLARGGKGVFDHGARTEGGRGGEGGVRTCNSWGAPQ